MPSEYELKSKSNSECLSRAGFIPLQESSNGFKSYFGGMYFSESFDIMLSPVPVLLEFDKPLPLSGTAFVPGTIALDTSGVYLISYEMDMAALSTTVVNAQVLANASPLGSSSGSIELQKNRIASLQHTTFAKLSASDELELELTAEDEEIIIVRHAQLTLMRIGT
ncbi:MAG: hypothetical protein FWG10_07300 [Eubacteriaceae bacterium]|nr:hypothetical protein [Eubacteriaceae bacterium]